MISVVTVCYNARDLISKTIKSVLGQNYDDFEYLIIDGLSTDGTIELVKSIFKSFSHCNSSILSERDHGIYDAMNKAIKLAKGEFVVFINAGDTFYNENTLSDVASYLKFHPETDVLYGDCGYFEEKTITKAAPFWTQKRPWRGIGFCHQATYTRKSLLLEHPFNLDFSLCADFELCWHLYYKKHSIFSYINKPLCRFDLGGVSYNLKNRFEITRQGAIIGKADKSFYYYMLYIRYMIYRFLPKYFRNYLLNRAAIKYRNNKYN